MDTEERLLVCNGVSPFERIRRTNAAGAEYWSSRDFAQVLGYSYYRNFEQAMKRAKTACFNSGQPIEDHFVEITEMISIGSEARIRRTIPELSGIMPEDLRRPSAMDATQTSWQEDKVRWA